MSKRNGEPQDAPVDEGTDEALDEATAGLETDDGAPMDAPGEDATPARRGGDHSAPPRPAEWDGGS